MTLRMTSLTPAAFVDELVSPGLATSIGPVALRQYVSTAARSPLAAAVRVQLDELMRQGGDGPRALRALQTRCNERDESQWRRLFSGTGHLDRLVELWEWMLAQRSLLAPLPPPLGASGPTWDGWFAQSHPIQAMVDAEVFGLDCLGFVSQYLRRAGLMDDAPTWNVRGFGTAAGLRPVTRSDQVEPLSLLLFPRSAHHAQHIALVSRVDAVLGDNVRVDLCQSSRGGPQTNRRVVIGPGAGSPIEMGHLSMSPWSIPMHGTPPAPVQEAFVVMRHPGWRLGV
ncbi:MAG: hypothetical protein U1F56_19985 [Rubrivivax sp.]